MLKKIFLVLFVTLVLLVLSTSQLSTWGFWGHHKINRMAVFTLPPEMIGFYKNHIEYITDHAVDPDKLCFSNADEHPRHFIDFDHYGPDANKNMPKKWKDAVAKYTEDTLKAHGINPWWVEITYRKLVKAFKDEDVDKILYTSACLGHYVADGHVPLHTTHFYNGKTPEQKGIHAFWESRIPELMGDNFDYFVGRAQYIKNPLDKAWSNIYSGNQKVDTIYMVYEKMSRDFSPDQMFIFEQKGKTMMKQYSEEYTKTFEKLMNNMAERRMRESVLSVGSYWYSAWVDAGQPDLTMIEAKEVSDAHKKELEEKEYLWKHGTPKGRASDDEGAQ